MRESNVKYTNIYIREFVKDLGYELLSNENINPRSELILRDSEGYIYLSSFNNLNRGRTPLKFYDKNPYTIQNIKIWLKLNSKTVELNSESYTGCFEELRWKCLICGDEFSMSWDHMNRSLGCVIKHGVRSALSCFNTNKRPTKLTIEYVSEFVECLGYQLLSTEYINTHSKLILRDSEGYKYLCPYGNLHSGKTPLKFHENNPYTIQNIKLWLKINKKSIELISDTYTKSDEELIWKCLVCGDEFPMSWARMSQSIEFYIRHGTQPDLPCFNPNKKLTILKVKEFVENLGYELLSTEYKNNKQSLALRDNLGYLYSARYDNLKSGKKPEAFNINNPYTIENIRLRLRLKYPKFQLVTEEYLGSDSELILKDSDGYLYNTCWEVIQKGFFPWIVSSSNRFSVDNIILWCNLNKKPFELISKKYVCTKEDLEWRCFKKNCNEIFLAPWDNILQGQGCSYCSGQRVGLSNCLATINPKLASEWYQEKNGDLTPYHVTSRSGIYACWICTKCKHQWHTRIADRSNGDECPKCYNENRRGENHPNWQGGITPINQQIRLSDSYKQWRDDVFKRDNYTCQCCGDKTGHNLAAHHIENFSQKVELRFDVTNGITLCDACHNPNKNGSFHHMYGTQNNTKEQLDEYIEIIQSKKL